MRTLTNWPGHSASVALGNSALRRIVPVVWSTWLSITRSTPRSITVLAVGRQRFGGELGLAGAGSAGSPR